MILSIDELKSIYKGAYYFDVTKDGYLQAYQYSKPQMDYFKNSEFTFWGERCDASTAKTIELITEATSISFEYKLIWISSKDTFEAWIDGIANEIIYLDKIGEEGKIEFKLPAGKKNVCIYTPSDATALIRNFEINGSFETVKKGDKVLWLGDSITQGYGPLRSAHTYVSVANRLLNYDIINQGIGGYIYDKKSLMKMDGYTPDKIIVALGTNQYGTESMKDIEEYYEVLTDIYKDIPILCITPLWRGDNMDGIPKLISFCEKIKEIVAKYKQITVVDGFGLVPHLSEYYLDNLHPNCLGTEMYGIRLVEEIRRIGF